MFLVPPGTAVNILEAMASFLQFAVPLGVKEAIIPTLFSFKVSPDSPTQQEDQACIRKQNTKKL